MFEITKINGKRLLFTLPEGSNLLLVCDKENYSAKLWNDSYLFHGIYFSQIFEMNPEIEKRFIPKEDIHFTNHKLIVGERSFNVYLIEIIEEE